MISACEIQDMMHLQDGRQVRATLPWELRAKSQISGKSGRHLSFALTYESLFT